MNDFSCSATPSNTLDLVVSNGDLLVADTTAQDQWLAIFQHQGENLQYPLIGAGADSLLLDHQQHAAQRAVIEALRRSGMQVNRVNINLQNSIFHVDAFYPSRQ